MSLATADEVEIIDLISRGRNLPFPINLAIGFYESWCRDDPGILFKLYPKKPLNKTK